MTGDMPTFLDAGHAHAVYSANNLSAPLLNNIGTMSTAAPAALRGGLMPAHQAVAAPIKIQAGFLPKEKQMSRRLVQVFIADPDENLPLEQGILYSGSQKFTDATDQELFFEVDIQAILKAHNDKRITVANKKVKDRVEYLEPAKIRDLKMVVVTVATF
jgi:hypothetical protein